LAYQLTKAKVHVVTSTDDAATVKFFQSRLAQGTDDQRVVARYGLGLALLKGLKFKESEAIFQDLVKTYPNQPQYASALARNALEARDYPTALARYKKLTEHYPENEAIRLEYVTGLLRVGNPEQAKDNLMALSPQTQKLPIYWQLLAQIYDDLKQPVESHRYLAEYYYAVGQTQNAIMQIKLAQKSKGLNFYTNSILNERLNFFFIQEQEARRRN
jgi:predicted Zn-dependent protease